MKNVKKNHYDLESPLGMGGGGGGLGLNYD